jgi:hypothetical protein
MPENSSVKSGRSGVEAPRNKCRIDNANIFKKMEQISFMFFSFRLKLIADSSSTLSMIFSHFVSKKNQNEKTNAPNTE